MTKSILMSIQPKWVCEILNGRKTIEIRRKFPKDYCGWVYIYCTYGTPKQNVMYWNKENGKYVGNHCCLEHCLKIDGIKTTNKNWSTLCDSNKWEMNGKVVARFWVDNVGIIKCHNCLSIPTMAYTTFVDKYYSDTDLQTASCLNGNELMWYLGTKKEEVGYAIHISKLEVFDKPKELSEFKKYGMIKYLFDHCTDDYVDDNWNELLYLQKAPQSWQYIEVE